MTTIILVRHGTTAWNHERRYQGQLDIPLNQSGEEEAVKVAQHLRSEKLSALYSSKLGRAVKTAEIIAGELGSQLKVNIVEGLQEIDVGTWSGLTPTEVQAKFPDQFALFEADKNLPRGGGESRAQLEARTVAAIEGIARLHPSETVALVTHGAVIKVLAGWALQLPLLYQPNFHGVTNSSLTYIEVEFTPRRRTRLAAYNLTTDGGSPLSVEMSEG